MKEIEKLRKDCLNYEKKIEISESDMDCDNVEIKLGAQTFLKHYQWELRKCELAIQGLEAKGVVDELWETVKRLRKGDK